MRTTVAARPQLVIFDLDGTLTDSAQGIVSSFRHALGEIGAAVPDGDLAGRIVGPPMHHTLRAMGLGEDVRRRDRRVPGRLHHPRLGDEQAVRRRPGAARRPAGRRGAAGGGHLEGRADGPAHPRALRPRRHFEVIAGASVDGSRATKADVVAHALAQLEPLPERVLMVGDRSHDVEGAAAHGIDTVVVGWGYGREDFADPTRSARSRTSATVADLREVLGV